MGGWEILMLENSEFVFNVLTVAGWWVYEGFLYTGLLPLTPDYAGFVGPEQVPVHGYGFDRPITDEKYQLIKENARIMSKTGPNLEGKF